MLCACWTGWRASRSLRGKHRFLSSLHKLCIQLQSLRDKDFLDHCVQVCFLSTDLIFLLAHPYPTTAFLHRGYLPGTKTTAFSNASTHQTVSKLHYLNRQKINKESNKQTNKKTQLHRHFVVMLQSSYRMRIRCAGPKPRGGVKLGRCRPASRPVAVTQSRASGEERRTAAPWTEPHRALPSPGALLLPMIPVVLPWPLRAGNNRRGVPTTLSGVPQPAPAMPSPAAGTAHRRRRKAAAPRSHHRCAPEGKRGRFRCEADMGGSGAAAPPPRRAPPCGAEVSRVLGAQVPPRPGWDPTKGVSFRLEPFHCPR